MKRFLTVSVAAIFYFSLGGCATLIAPLSDTRLDADRGHRTFGAKVEDEAIEYKALVNLRRQAPPAVRGCISVTSWNGQVLLSGQAPDEEARARAADVVAAIRHVQQVHNEVSVGDCAGALTHTSDAFITARVKFGLLFAADIPARRVKLVTENGTLFMMGLLTQAEAAQVIETTRDAWGVQKIVKIFEYIDG